MKIIKTRTLTYCVIDHKEAKVSDYVVAKLVKPVFTSIVYPLAHTVELLESGLKKPKFDKFNSVF